MIANPSFYTVNSYKTGDTTPLQVFQPPVNFNNPSFYNMGNVLLADTFSKGTVNNNYAVPFAVQTQNQTNQFNQVVPIPLYISQEALHSPNENLDLAWVNKLQPYKNAANTAIIQNSPIISNIPTTYTPNLIVNPLDLSKARKYKLDGNNARAKGDYKEAILAYKKALAIDPYYTDVLYNIGRSYTDIGEIDNAIESFKKLLTVDPKDFETRTLLGEIYDNKGNLELAITEYLKVLEIEPKYDFAKRNYLSSYFKKLALTNPSLAKAQGDKLAELNLAKAIELIKLYATDNTYSILKTMNIQFGMTEEVNKYENMAQYEHSNNRILISNKLRYADPSIIATYLVHESVHASDKDEITSVWEEQDAFEEMTKFWIKINNGLLDPDLTLAENLYKEHPEKLNSKVALIYVKRDPNIRRTSPYHGEPGSQEKYVTSLYNAIKSLITKQSSTDNSTQSKSSPLDDFIKYVNRSNTKSGLNDTPSIVTNSNLRLEEDR